MYCDQCKITFKHKFNYKRHIENKHTNKDYLIAFECDTCNAKFSRKDNLQRHILRNHAIDPIEKTLFECDKCKSKFLRKENLKRHIFQNHAIDPSERTLFECSKCGIKFCRKDTLTRHLLKYCKNLKEGKMACVKCGDSFISRSLLNDHYAASHAVPLKWTNIEFRSFEEFEKWMYDIERKNTFRFIVIKNNKNKSYVLKSYTCHRSGVYKDSCANKRRKRFLKNSGSKKLQGWCPAAVNVKIESSGVCKVQYQETHVGHSIGTEEELVHVYLNKNEKLELATRIAEGVPITHLKQRIHLSEAASQGGNRIGTINLKDLHNIASKYGIRRDGPVSFESDKLNVNAFTDEFNESVLYCKWQGEVDTQYNTLFDDDLAIVVMSKSQESKIKSFGGKLVCFDGTHDTKPYNFILHTMLIVDDRCEGKPVTFLVTNSNEKRVIDVFLKCIRDKVGVIETKSFMTDMEAPYYNSWIDVMGNEPAYHLYCAWHVHEAWRQNYSKISNRVTRKKIKIDLNKLLHELEPAIFEEKLVNFCQMLENDPDAEKFSKYFNHNYVENTHRWAYCYRLDSGINTNVCIEGFHRRLRANTGRRKTIESLTECLQYLQDYLAVQKNEDRVKRIRNQSTNKLHILRNRHHKVLDHLEEKKSVLVDHVDDKTFIVESFKDSGENIPKVYTVTRNDSIECQQLGSVCQLFCNLCKICFHEYSCNCADSAIRNNMCKHIHAVGIAGSQSTNIEDIVLVPQNQNDNLDCENAEANFKIDLSNIENIRSEENICIIEDEEPFYDIKYEETICDIEDEESFCNMKCEETIRHIEDGHEVDEEKKRVTQELMELVAKSLSVADSVEQLYEIKKKFINPIRQSLLATNRKQKSSFLHESN